MSPRIIRARCAECRNKVDTGSAGIRLYVCKNRAELSHYRFWCPVCDKESSLPADRAVTALLVRAGVVAETWSLPEEALEPRNGPALTLDDLLDFSIALQRCTNLVEAAA